MGVALVVLGVVVVLTVAATLVPLRRDPITGAAFVTGWLTGELAGQYLVLNLVLVGIFVRLAHSLGTIAWIGLSLDIVGSIGLLILLVNGFLSRGVVRRSMRSIPGMPIDPSEAMASPRWGRWWRTVVAIPWAGRSIELTKDVAYVEGAMRQQLLDVYRSRTVSSGAPVMIYVHGGAWVFGDKREQGKPMMFELCARGWVCVTVNYRLSPKATWPDHIVDVLRAIAWVKEHIGEFGGDPSFVALSGGSAGGHLAALAALSTGDPAYQPGFEDIDTSVDACIPLYGVLEMTGDKQTSGLYGPGLQILLERQVMKASIAENPETFTAASPLHRVTASAPPFLVIHGTNDTLVPVAVPRAFVPALRAVSLNPVGYIELPLAQHAFDVVASPRCSATTAGIVAFLDEVRRRSIASGEFEETAARE